jgi:hypothetical protein
VVVRRAGYGAMQLAGDGVFGPPRDRDEALRVLRAAVAAGVDHIDTAQFYGAGTVNELIREALYPHPDDLAIVSKVGVRRDAGSVVLRPEEARELRQGIEDNLRALGTGRLAALNLRIMDPSQAPGRRFDAQLAVVVGPAGNDRGNRNPAERAYWGNGDAIVATKAQVGKPGRRCCILIIRRSWVRSPPAPLAGAPDAAFCGWCWNHHHSGGAVIGEGGVSFSVDLVGG